MFSRRHPYLYFILVFSVVITAAIIIMSILLAVWFRDSDFAGLNEIAGEKVGIIEVTGVIADSEDAIRTLKSFREDDSIKAIVLRINSPGGGVGPSQEIFREVRKTVPSKKIIASMGSIAASGGYYIAAGTDGIMANPGTITGSIGVIMGHTNFQEVLNKIGLVPVVVKSGTYKDMGSPLREMTQDEKMILQEFVNKIHKQFVRDVSEGRNMNEAQMRGLADGRIFSGEEAKSLGLIDRLGNFEDAIEWAGRMGGIKGKISTVYARKKKFSLLKYLTGSSLKELVNQSFNSCLYADFFCVPSSNN
ncbi:MAG: signal peptide peptidase SppA [Desulfobacterales bacterium]|nr:signal peptide peptidase SppA [Desulfobacterales bacterium]